MGNLDNLVGCLLGTAVGDALGLPSEGLSKHRQQRLYPQLHRYHFWLGKGMVSDDTEHTCMVAQALLASGGDETEFARQLSWRMRFWLLGLPAGIGWATLRAISKLWLGFPSDSASAHAGLRLVSPPEYYQTLAMVLEPAAGELLALIQQAITSVTAGQTTAEFALSLGLKNGITGYIYRTVPVVIHAWLRSQPDYRTGILEIIHCGGDTDTTAAILGGIMGAAGGKSSIPQVWLDDLIEWPRSVQWITALGQRLAEVTHQGTRQPALPLPLWGVLIRNLVFLIVVILHGFRRLLPPY
jgi:ADP-ribosylglycohydrolase